MRLSGHEAQQRWGNSSASARGAASRSNSAARATSLSGQPCTPASSWLLAASALPWSMPSTMLLGGTAVCPTQALAGTPWSPGMVSPPCPGTSSLLVLLPPVHCPSPAATRLRKPLQGWAAKVCSSPPAFVPPQCHPHPTSHNARCDSRTPAGMGSAAAASHIATGQPCCSHWPHVHSNNCKRQIIAVV